MRIVGYSNWHQYYILLHKIALHYIIVDIIEVTCKIRCYPRVALYAFLL